MPGRTGRRDTRLNNALNDRLGKKFRQALVVAATAILALVLWTGSANGDVRKCDAFVSAEIAAGSRHGWSRVIVSTDKALTPAQTKQILSLGAYVTRRFTVINAFACSVPKRSLTALTDLSFVRHVSSDARVKKTDDFIVPVSGADVAYSTYKLDGTGIGVAVIDSGIKSGTSLHLDLKTKTGTGSRVVVLKNFVTGQTSTDDAAGHGTHVAGIIAGNGLSSTGSSFTRTFYGIARNANLISLRVLNAQGSGNVSDVIAAIQWAVANKNTYKIRVINLSLGHLPGDSYLNDPLCLACEAAWNSGIVVVCAAGNSGRANVAATAGLDNEGYGTAYGSINSPGNDPMVITVGAMKKDTTSPSDRSLNKIATYSSRGPTRVDLVLKPDLVAPGNKVISTRSYKSTLEPLYDSTNMVPSSSYSTKSTITSGYFVMSGTSMAAPVVTGAVALMLQKDTTLSPDTVKARLMVSADKWTDASGNADPCTYGAGYLNIPAALASTVVATQTAYSPFLMQDDAGNVCVNLDKAIWGIKAIWGTGITDLKAIWGIKAIWGTNTLSSSKAIWGTAVWGDKAIWGVSTMSADMSTTALKGD